MADTKFMNFAEVTPNGNDSVLVGNESNGVRRAKLANLADAIGALIVDAQLNENGYVKFSNGFIIQWGSIGETQREAGLYTQNFNVPFVSFANVMITPYSGGVTIAVPSVNLTKFEYEQSGRNYSCRWLAIGV